MCEVAGRFTQYTLADLDDMPTVEFRVLHERLALSEYREHLPIAMLTAQVLNALGGKGGGGKSTPSWKLFDPHELLPGYAQPAALYRDLPFTPRQCGAIMDAVANRDLPNWVVQVIGSIMPFDQVIRLGGQRQGEGRRDDGFEQWMQEDYAEV